MSNKLFKIISKIKNKFIRNIYAYKNRKRLREHFPRELSSSSSAKIDIIIWGCNAFSAALCHLLENENIHVVAFIDHTLSSFCEKPVYRTDAFKQDNLTDIPIVIAVPHLMSHGLPSINFDTIQQFQRVMQEIIHSYQIKNDLLHPAALLDLISLKFPNKIVSFGMPGSGNTFFNNICFQLASRYEYAFATNDKTSLFFERLCSEYTQCILHVLMGFVHNLEGYNLQMASWKINTTFLLFYLNAVPVRLYAFATRNYITDPVYGYHKIPSEAYLKKLRSQYFNLFFIMRNPLDMILSILNKSAALDRETKQIDMNKFCVISKWVVDQLNTWYPLIALLNVIQYEEIITHPIITFKKITNHLGFTISDNEAKRVWEELSFKQLPSAPKKHFWSGGAGKWEIFFKKEHFSFLKSIGIEKVLQKYNYLTVLSQFKQFTSTISANEWQSSTSDELMKKIKKPLHVCGGDEYDNTLDKLMAVHGKEACIVSKNLYVVCEDETLHEKLNHIMNGYINRLISAGSHSTYRNAML